MSPSIAPVPFPDVIYRHVERIMRAASERLEADCVQAVTLQEYGKLDRLEIVDVMMLEGNGLGPPRCYVASRWRDA